MQPILSLDDLKNRRLRENQHWYYVVLANANDPTRAASLFFCNIDYFDITSGKTCDFFIPGLIYGYNGKIVEKSTSDMLKSYVEGQDPPRFSQYNPHYQNIRDYPFSTSVHIDRLGELPFFGREFARFCCDLTKECEHNGNYIWQYSGGCELLVFSVDHEMNRIDTRDFFCYNLDDIVNNGNTVIEFIQQMINITGSNIDKITAKRAIDQLYYDLVIPENDNNNIYQIRGARLFYNAFPEGTDYTFISYSTKNFRIVHRMYELLTNNGVKCWMAPHDIPRGTSYPLIIEHAIKNASNFVLMLSENSVQSIWCEKELLRAIHYFQVESPEKINIVWLYRQFSLDGTAFALPAENIQNKIVLDGDTRKCTDLCSLIDPDLGNKWKLKSNVIDVLKRINQIEKPKFEKIDKILNKIKAVLSGCEDDNREARLELSYQLLKRLESINRYYRNSANTYGGLYDLTSNCPTTFVETYRSLLDSAKLSTIDLENIIKRVYAVAGELINGCTEERILNQLIFECESLKKNGSQIDSIFSELTSLLKNLQND